MSCAIGWHQHAPAASGFSEPRSLSDAAQVTPARYLSHRAAQMICELVPVVADHL